MVPDPTMFEVVLCGIIGGIFTVFAVVAGIYWFAEYWRTRRGTTRYFWAYGKGDTCNQKFITGSDYRR